MSTPSAPYGFFPGTGIPRKRPASDHDGRGTCKTCGETGLVWEKHYRGGDDCVGHWVLCSVGGKRHVCKKVEQ